MAEHEDFLRTPVWYPVLAAHTFLTRFLRHKPKAVNTLAIS